MENEVSVTIEIEIAHQMGVDKIDKITPSATERQGTEISKITLSAAARQGGTLSATEGQGGALSATERQGGTLSTTERQRGALSSTERHALSATERYKGAVGIDTDWQAPNMMIDLIKVVRWTGEICDTHSIMLL